MNLLNVVFGLSLIIGGVAAIIIGLFLALYRR